ncbi:MAG: N-acetylmuramoyl-L-alanine amidase [Elusimicrobiota bacterium]|nr:MAG: N-acetylmuramoyl-L-alanine amidase [Elusimicrobiota bacterium]
MRAEALAAALVLAAAPSLAGDLGTEVTFASARGARFAVQAGPPAPRVLFDSGDSDAPAGEWDVLLIQGELPDPSVRFMALRPGGATVWVELAVHRRADGRFWAKGRFQRKAGPLRLRAVDAGIAADHEVTVYSAEVFADSPDAPAAAAPPARGPADPAAVPPAHHARAAWGARAPTNPLSPDPMPWRVTLHHSDGRYTASLAESLQEARFIQEFHQDGRGWSDVGYHFLVDPLGNILEGRPLGTLGAHTQSNNEGNVGIVLLGSYHAPKNHATTAAQLASAAALGRFLVARFGLDPDSLKGHRDYKKTDCPGDLAYPKLPELRRAFDVPRAPAIAASPDWDGQRGSSSAAKPTTDR